MKRCFRMLAGFIAIALMFGCGVLLFVALRAPKLEQGLSYTFYLGESSSARAVTSKSPLAKLFLGDVKGESVVYCGDRYEEFAQKYGAKLLFTERLNGVVSYYLYSPKMGKGVALGGETVNLQIAVSDGQTVVGTPLIFGGW